MPLILFGCSRPISSIMQCTMNSPLFRAAFFLNTLMSMMFTIAFTKMSVPSEPTLLMRSTQLVLQLMRKTFEVIHYLTVHLIAIIVRKKVQLTNREGILSGVVVNRHEQLHQPVRRFVCP